MADPFRLADAFGRTISYLRLSVTDRCNFRCAYCRRPKGEVEPRFRPLPMEQTVRLARIFSELGVTKFRITGGEPLMRTDIIDLVGRIAAMPKVEEVSLSTNAFLLEEYARSLKQAGLARVNISLDSLDPEVFRIITREGDLNRVARGIDAALAAGLHPVKLNMVVMGGINDREIPAMIRFAGERNLLLRLIESMPVGEAGEAMMGTYVSTPEIMARIQETWGGELAPGGPPTKGNGPARYFKVTGLGVDLGIISALSQHFCDACNRVRLTSWGDLVPCLGQSDRVALGEALDGTDEEVKQVIAEAIYNKPRRHEFQQRKRGPHAMAELGG